MREARPRSDPHRNGVMMTLIPKYEGPAVSLTQRGHTFYYIPMPANDACRFLGFQHLRWGEENSAFSGFNRDLKPAHVQEIFEGLAKDDTLMPNSVIAYFLNENLRFTPTGRGDTAAGTVEILVPEDNDSVKVGFIIDGQHRVEALGRRELEEGEEDLTIGIVALHSPADADARVVFEKVVLEQMAIINSALPLSDNDKLLVDQRLDHVSTKFGRRKSKMSTASLIARDLDTRENCPLKFKAADKTPPSGRSWLALNVWVRALAGALESQGVLRGLFPADFSDDQLARKKAVHMIDLYLRAIYGLIADKDLWEAPTRRQRLYHNVGMGVLLALIDDVNQKAGVFSTMTPGKLKLNSDDECVKRLQKHLKAVRLVDWTVGAPDAKAKDKIEPLVMASVQNQKGIPQSLRDALRSLVAVCDELQEEGGEHEHVFEIRDSAGLVVARQKIRILSENLRDWDKAIDRGEFLRSFKDDVVKE